MKISVIGANGQLGTDVCRAFRDNGDDVIGLNHEHIEISDHNDTRSTLGDIDPDFVVNTAAMHNVEECEKDPEKSFAVNGIGARNLALASQEIGFTLMHISTDYVFDGVKQSPYLESDCPRPLNVYGNTKIAGEFFVETIAEQYFILRVSAIYGESLCRAKGGLNFVTLMLKLASERDEIRVVNDEFVSPTYTRDIAKQIVHMAGSSHYGLYHGTSQGSCSWYDFAAKIFELTGSTVKLTVADPGEFPAKVPRPTYSVLENKGLQEAKLDIMPPWEKGLKSYLKTLREK
ncbi:dTDP-4-dehydrorhamnose reductase (EC [Olavius algarvensis associated proteobacterium Delta 3]|nr:dTDP-4-dehydrorhamnose reductase (EC [Olavius algarvensis associated proteobacterium Delta 3]CAB5123100.1 dTDP-4-dehydrorhamnose reductase (EC [Olavius algarvensis associated proteobacterium Delta 3]